MRALAEDGGIGMEGDFRAAPVLHAALVFEPGLGCAALIALRIERLIAGYFHLEAVGKGIHYRNADAVKAARCFIGLTTKLAAGMERGEDDFECRLVPELRMRVHRNAAAIIGNGKGAVLGKRHLDPV